LTYLAAKLKIITKPDDLNWEEILAVGFIGGIGFTMSIFITQLAFVDATMIGAVKLGIFIASFIAGIVGVMLILNVHKKKVAREEN
jgi:NhaA family Na+:H+ antiporter